MMSGGEKGGEGGERLLTSATTELYFAIEPPTPVGMPILLYRIPTWHPSSLCSGLDQKTLVVHAQWW